MSRNGEDISVIGYVFALWVLGSGLYTGWLVLLILISHLRWQP